MSKVDNSRRDYGIFLDIPYVLRTYKIWFFSVLCAAIVAGSLAFIGCDYFMKDTYTAQVVVAVVSRYNTTSALADSQNGSGVTRNLNMWNSNVLRKAIRDAYIETYGEDGKMKDGDDFTVNLTATSVSGASLIKLTSTSDTAEKAYFVLNTAITEYSKVSDSFDPNYYSKVLTRMNEGSISVEYKKSWMYGAGIFAATLFGILLLLFVISLVTDTLHNEEQAKRLLDMSLYEALGPVKKKKGVRRILISDPNTPVRYCAEIDRLASRVEQHMLHYKQKILMITSIHENEGKSTIAANLSLNLAKRGYRVLLVDLDFRRPALYRIFEQEKHRSTNLSTALRENIPATERITHNPDLNDLDVLWQYKSVKDSDRLLENSTLGLQLKKLKKNYDFILLDTPPMGPVRDADTVALMADCSLLIMRQDICRAKAANDVRDQLEEFGAPVIGAVFNDYAMKKNKNRKGSKYGYEYSSYNKGYGYGYGHGYGNSQVNDGHYGYGTTGVIGASEEKVEDKIEEQAAVTAAEAAEQEKNEKEE